MELLLECTRTIYHYLSSNLYYTGSFSIRCDPLEASINSNILHYSCYKEARNALLKASQTGSISVNKTIISTLFENICGQFGILIVK